MRCCYVLIPGGELVIQGTDWATGSRENVGPGVEAIERVYGVRELWR